MDVHLRDLRYFVAVAEELHFSRAAERLFISQPALSKQIRQLERALQVSLFHREGRSVSLSEPGESLLPLARQLISGWDEAQRELRETARRESASIVVGIATGVGRGLTGRVQASLAKRRERARLEFRQVGWDDPTAGLADGDTDAALLWLPLPEKPRLSSEVLLDEPRVVLVPSDHTLAAKTEVDLADLAGESLLALPETAGPLREFWLGADAGFEPKLIGGEVRSADETFEAVASGAGLALASAGNAEIYAHEGVTARPVRGLAPAQLAVAWRSDDGRALISDFVDAALKAATDARAGALG